MYLELSLTKEERVSLLQRPSTLIGDTGRIAQDVCLAVKQRGDDAVREYGRKFDKAENQALRVSKEEIEAAGRLLPPNFWMHSMLR